MMFQFYMCDMVQINKISNKKLINSKQVSKIAVSFENHEIHGKFKFSWRMAKFTENVTAVKSWIRLFPTYNMYKVTWLSES